MPSLQPALRVFIFVILLTFAPTLLFAQAPPPPQPWAPATHQVAGGHVAIGQPVPDFTANDAHGQSISLSQYRGKFVVLEWTEPECPFVHKFYDGGALQKLQHDITARGIIWLRINSSGEGSPNYQSPEQAALYDSTQNVGSTATLIDPDGHVGHLFGARTALHMFVIDPQGTLIYAGAIDSIPSPDPSDIPNAKNYVQAALDEALVGKPVSVPTTAPYGCHIKYGR